MSVRGRLAPLPCHRSTCARARAGVLVEDPPLRSVDTVRLEVDDGTITIQSGVRQNGGRDNPRGP